jgi:hypothetical protein
MCEKCANIDRKIAHYRGLTVAIGDRLTVDRINALIEELQTQKAALHPGEVT